MLEVSSTHGHSLVALWQLFNEVSIHTFIYKCAILKFRIIWAWYVDVCFAVALVLLDAGIDHVDIIFLLFVFRFLLYKPG
jgi:hypothetical protein